MYKLNLLPIIIGLLISQSPLKAQEVMKENLDAVKSIDGIVNEILRYVTGEKGKRRNFQAFRNLFLPSTRFTVLMHETEDGSAIESVNLDEFIELLKDPYYDDFEERELHKVVDEYNGIAQVFQTFYGKDIDGMEEKGITSYQLVYFDDRWWIVNVLWTGSSNGVKIPDMYLED